MQVSTAFCVGTKGRFSPPKGWWWKRSAARSRSSCRHDSSARGMFVRTTGLAGLNFFSWCCFQHPLLHPRHLARSTRSTMEQSWASQRVIVHGFSSFCASGWGQVLNATSARQDSHVGVLVSPHTCSLFIPFPLFPQKWRTRRE